MNMPIRPIDIGDFAPTVRLLNQKGRKAWAYDINLAGRPVAYLILRNTTAQTALAALEAFKNVYQEFENLGAQVVVISNLQHDGNVRLINEMNLPFFVLSDEMGHYASSYRVSDDRDAVACALVDRNCRLLKLLQGQSAPRMAELALKVCGQETTATSGDQIMMQAPVLLVPRVFEPDFCKQLIKYWRQGDKEEDRITRRKDNDTSDLGNDKMKRRSDVLIPEGNHPVNLQVRQRLSMRVMPELEKAFDHKASRYELARVGCYDSAKEGFFSKRTEIFILGIRKHLGDLP